MIDSLVLSERLELFFELHSMKSILVNFNDHLLHHMPVLMQPQKNLCLLPRIKLRNLSLVRQMFKPLHTYFK